VTGARVVVVTEATVVVVTGARVVVVTASDEPEATVVVGRSVTQPAVGDTTLTMAMSAIGTTAITETRCIEERNQRIIKIPATTAKIANTATVVLLPVSGNTQSSAAFMNAPYVKFFTP
jgi:hypothetical protein